MYAVAKEACRANLTICALQEVRWTGSGAQVIEVNTGEQYEFHWSGYKRKREAGVGLLIRQSPDIVIGDVNYIGPRLMSASISIKGFNTKVIVAYAPTDATNTYSKCKAVVLERTRQGSVR